MRERKKVSFAMMVANFDIFEWYDVFNRIIRKFFSKKLKKTIEIKKIKKIGEEELMTYVKTEKGELVRVFIKKINSEINIEDIGVFPYIVYSDSTLKIKIESFSRVVFNVARAIYPHTYLRTFPPFLLYDIANKLALNYGEDLLVSRIILSKIVKYSRYGQKVEEVTVKYPKSKSIIDILDEFDLKIKNREWIKGISIRHVKEGFSINIKRNGVITIIDRDPTKRFYEIFGNPIRYLLKETQNLKKASRDIKAREDIIGIRIRLLSEEDVIFSSLVENVIRGIRGFSFFITADIGGIVGSLDLIDRDSGAIFSIIKLKRKEIFIAPKSYATIPTISKIVDEIRNKLNGENIVIEKVF